MKILKCFYILLTLALLVSGSVRADDFFEAQVDKVLDGDKILLRGGTLVQFMGVEGPKTRDDSTLFDDIAEESLEYTKSMIERKKVRIRLSVPAGVPSEDSRKFAYVYCKGQMLNALLLKKGYAIISSTFPPDYEFEEYFEKCQNQAVNNKAGMWAQMVSAMSSLNKKSHVF